jgi:predicted flavoprotein YhiN
MAESLGHSIVKVRAALAPIKLRGDRWTPLSGVAFRDCVLRARQNGRIVSNWRGDTLITHHGISGPCTLGISREVAEARERGGVTIEIDLVPELDQDELAASILDYSKANPNRLLSTYLSELLPERFADEFMVEAGLSASPKFSNLNKALRN